MNNRELKLYAASKGVRLWQVAEKFGITDAAFSRKLRKEFSKEDAEQFKVYVDEIASIKDLDKMNGIAFDLASENDDLIEKLDGIRAEIEVNKKGFPPSSDYYKAITRAINIFDKYRKGE